VSPRKAPPEPVRAADCPRSFTLLAEGGVRVRWGCGAEVVDRKETAVDVAVLRERAAFQDHHHVLHMPHRRGKR
jgi:hypothetical protein